MVGISEVTIPLSAKDISIESARLREVPAVATQFFIPTNQSPVLFIPLVLISLVNGSNISVSTVCSLFIPVDRFLVAGGSMLSSTSIVILFAFIKSKVDMLTTSGK